MFSPPHPRDLLREYLDVHGYTVDAMAEHFLLDPFELHRVLEGRISFSFSMAVRLESALGVSARLLLRMQAAHDATRS